MPVHDPKNVSYEGVYGRPLRGKNPSGDDTSTQTHRFEVFAQPQYGTVELKSSGRFIYRPELQETDSDPPKTDVWWVRVTDSGQPPFSGFAKITLTFYRSTSWMQHRIHSHHLVG